MYMYMCVFCVCVLVSWDNDAPWHTTRCRPALPPNTQTNTTPPTSIKFPQPNRNTTTTGQGRPPFGPAGHRQVHHRRPRRAPPGQIEVYKYLNVSCLYIYTHNDL